MLLHLFCLPVPLPDLLGVTSAPSPRRGFPCPLSPLPKPPTGAPSSHGEMGMEPAQPSPRA